MVAPSRSLRKELREALEDVGGIEVVAEAEDGIEGIRVLDEVDVDIAFIDIELPDIMGVEIVRGAPHAPRAAAPPPRGGCGSRACGR